MTLAVALLGYGRFGRALGERLLETGARVRALDAHTPPPAALAAGSPAELVATADTVVLAVPVAHTAAALAQLRPHLRPAHLVMDVGSVKAAPVAAMEAALGAEIPWIGTHPLFGPTSLSRGERPLRVVLCPNPMHPRALERAAALYRRMGCEILEREPESHDRHMAEGHALAYFVAKGFLDAGIALDVEAAPPSTRAIAQVVEAVREDAAHLFASLHRENPHAGEARRRLLEALEATDRALRAPPGLGEEAHRERGPLHMDEADEPPRLLEAREVIDRIDEELLALLARRAEVSLRAARAKAEAGRGVRDAKREAALLAARRGVARDLGLAEEAVEDVFQAILRLSRQHQQRG